MGLTGTPNDKLEKVNRLGDYFVLRDARSQ